MMNAEAPTLRPVRLLPFESEQDTLQAVEEQEIQQFTEVITSEELALSEQKARRHLFHPLGTIAMRAIASVQEGITKTAIHTQLKAANVLDAIDMTASNAKRYLGSNFGSIVVRTPLAILVFGGSIGFLKDARTAHAATNKATYQVVDGPWYIHATDPTVHSKTVGFAQTGDTITITCHETGENVDGDAEWDVVTDLNNGLQGVMADKGTNTPVTEGNEASQLTALGIPVCGSQDASSGSAATSNSQLQDQEPNEPHAVMFEPMAGMPNVPGLTDNSSVEKVPYSQWGASNCSDANVAAQVPPTANTLAGWSNGRLGPVYYLAAATPEQRARIHTIVEFDPGSTIDFEKLSPLQRVKHFVRRLDGSQNCDYRYDINKLLSDWLASNRSNRLIVVTGKDSEMKTNDNDPKSQSTYSGLWHYYFSGIWHKNQALQQQALVCDYNYLAHDKVVEDYGNMVANPPASCPSAPDSQHPLTPWRP